MELSLDGYTDLPPGKLAAVVTYLEMREPPALLPEPADARFQLVRAAPDPALYRDVFRRVGQDWLWFSRLRLDDAALRDLLADPGLEAYFLWHTGLPRGILELDWRQPPAVELAFLGVTAELVGSGAGRYLMAHALRLVWPRRPQRLWLHTCTLDHPKALAFYRSAGFQPYKRALEVVDDPRWCGIIPQGAAPGIPLL